MSSFIFTRLSVYFVGHKADANFQNSMYEFTSFLLMRFVIIIFLALNLTASVILHIGLSILKNY